jgi:hypothetical protein
MALITLPILPQIANAGELPPSLPKIPSDASPCFIA